MDNKKKIISISIVFITVSIFLIWNSLNRLKIIDPVLSNIELTENYSFEIDNKLKSKLKKDVNLVIVLDDLSCPLCLNEVVDLIDFVNNEYTFMDTIIWFVLTDSIQVQNYHDAIGRDVLYTYGPLNNNYISEVGVGNRLNFIRKNGNKILAHIPLSNNITPRHEKLKVFNFVLDIYSLK